MSADARRRAAPYGLLVAVVTTATVLALLATSIGQPFGPPALDVSARLPLPAEAPCDRWALLAGVGQERGAAVAIFTDGLAALPACSSAERTLVLRGTAARGLGAYAVASDDDGVAFAGYVDGEVELRVRGDLRVAFTNDLATADEDRNLHAALR